MTPEIVIKPERSAGEFWKEAWQYRELLFFLSWRDFIVRYKQTVVGIGWAVLRPLLSVIVLTFLFQRVAKLPANGEAYPLLVMVGLLPWQFFATTLLEGCNSVVANANLITKVYFPRIYLPLSTALTGAADMLVAFALTMGLMLFYGEAVTWRVLALPFFGFMLLVLAAGMALLVGGLTVKYRDVRHVAPFLVQLGFFISPVGYALSAVTEEWQWLYLLNPMSGIIEGFRWSLLGSDSLSGMLIASSCVMSLLVFSIGFYLFRKLEEQFADTI